MQNTNHKNAHKYLKQKLLNKKLNIYFINLVVLSNMSIKIKLFAKLEFSVYIVAMLKNKYHASNMLCLHQYRQTSERYELWNITKHPLFSMCSHWMLHWLGSLEPWHALKEELGSGWPAVLGNEILLNIVSHTHSVKRFDKLIALPFLSSSSFHFPSPPCLLHQRPFLMSAAAWPTNCNSFGT